MRRFVFFFVVLVLAHQSTLAAPLPADIQNRIVAVSGGGGAVATSPRAAEGDRSLKLWRNVGGTWQQKTLLPFFTYKSAAFSPDGKYLATLDMDDSEPYKRMWRLRIYEVATGELWREAADQDAWELLSWSRDSRYLTVVTFQSDWGGDENFKPKSITGAVWFWDLQNVSQPLPSPRLAVTVGERIASHARSPDNRAIAVGFGNNGRGGVWKRNKAAKPTQPAFQPNLTYTAPSADIILVAWSNNGRTLLTVSNGSNRLRFWDARTGKMLRSIRVGAVRRALWSPDDSHVALEYGFRIYVHRVRDGRQISANYDEYWFALLGWANKRSVRAWSRGEGLKTLRVR